MRDELCTLRVEMKKVTVKGQSMKTVDKKSQHRTILMPTACLK